MNKNKYLVLMGDRTVLTVDGRKFRRYRRRASMCSKCSFQGKGDRVLATLYLFAKKEGENIFPGEYGTFQFMEDLTGVGRQAFPVTEEEDDE